MKNRNAIIAVVAVLLLVGAFFLVKSSRAPESAMDGAMQNTQQTGTFSSIKDALTKSVSLKCAFTDEENRQTETYIKNGAVRANFTAPVPEDSGNMIMKNQTLYMWNAKNEGWMMKIPETPESGTQTTGGNGTASWGDTMEVLEKYKESCKPAVVADSLFTPPANVKFSDMSQLMKIVPTTPAGAGTQPQTEYNTEDLQKMMEQYRTEP